MHGPPLLNKGMGIGKLSKTFICTTFSPFQPTHMTVEAENRKSYRKYEGGEVGWGKVGYHFQLLYHPLVPLINLQS